MTATSPGTAIATRGRGAALRTGLAALILLLVLLQALLAGEWLAGKKTIDAHAANGMLVLLLAIVQSALVAGTVRTAVRRAALIGSTLLVLLVVVQLALGYGGFDSANQARALHLPNGLLIFGVATWNLVLARRASGEASHTEAGDD
ncbi:MAG TPA: hypothetical protein VFD32_00370 [Dehalococcoidia bacterium]|nr:hypothetical protein [Dehalococcoidia bacterium]